jgi:hypothetical protein
MEKIKFSLCAGEAMQARKLQTSFSLNAASKMPSMFREVSLNILQKLILLYHFTE